MDFKEYERVHRAHDKGVTLPVHEGDKPRILFPHETVDIGEDTISIALRNGAHTIISLSVSPLMCEAEVEAFIGIPAVLIAEISLGGEYDVAIFDRGPGSQGTMFHPYGRPDITVSDRFVVIDMGMAVRLNIASGSIRPIDTSPLMQLCTGEQCVIGRDQTSSQTNRDFTASGDTPRTLSRKQCVIAIDGDQLMVSDAHSTNGTTVVVASTTSNRLALSDDISPNE